MLTAHVEYKSTYTFTPKQHRRSSNGHVKSVNMKFAQTRQHLSSFCSEMALADLGRKRFVSQNALAELLKELRELPELPTQTSRSSIKRARDVKMDISTPLGPLFTKKTLPGNDGEKVEVVIAEPACHLYYLYKSSEAFGTFLKGEMVGKPSSFESPWNIVLYSDEVSPGNSLKPDNRRALCYQQQLFYCSHCIQKYLYVYLSSAWFNKIYL